MHNAHASTRAKPPKTRASNLELASDFMACALRYGADAADVLAIASTDINCSIRNNIPETLERSESFGLGLRVFVGGATASVSLSDVSRDTMDDMAKTAIAMARATPPDNFAALAPAEMLAHSMPDLDLYDATEPSLAELQSRCKLAEAKGLSHQGITNTEGADASYSTHAIALVTSQGAAFETRTSYSSLSLSLIAGKGATMQRDYAYSTARHAEDLLDAEAIGDEAAKRTLARLHPRKLSSASYPILFDPRVSRSLVSAFSSAISGSAITRGTSFLKDSLNKPVFARGIHIIDDPQRLRGLASRAIDAEGLATRKMALIDDGVLTTWLLDMRSANQLGLAPTAHASRSLGGAPYPGTSNCYMAAGAHSPTALMSDIKEGVYITETSGMGINLITGDYSQGAAGFMIRDGHIGQPVAEFTIAGHLREMFMHIIPANDLSFTYATNAPTLRIDGMTVAGI